MTIFEAIILGAVQGLTEFIPVSSSGHLVLVPWLFQWHSVTPDVAKTFDVSLHVGTFAALIIYFRATLVDLVRATVELLKRRTIDTFDQRLVLLIVVASVPAALVGFIFEGLIVKYLDSALVIACTLSLFGIIMFVVDRFSRTDRPMESLNFRDAIFIGSAQAIALAPGTSRSGVTLTAGILRGLTREAAVRFSFLMSVPIIGGTCAYKLAGLAADGLPPGLGPVPFVVGILVSFVTGYAAIAWLLRYLQKGTLLPFVIYRLVLSALIFTLIISGVRPPH